MRINEAEVKELMDKLKIDREEAEKLWLFDNGYDDDETVNELTKKAKEIHRYEKSDAPRKKGTKTRKVDEVKVEIVSTIAQNLTRVMLNDEQLSTPQNIVILKPEREITFTLNGDNYSVVLTKHRPPKK